MLEYRLVSDPKTSRTYQMKRKASTSLDDRLRRKAARIGGNYRPTRVQAVPLINPPRVRYVPRTLGGQVQAEDHYFDEQRPATFIVATPGSWAGCEMDPSLAQGCLFAPIIGDDIANRTARKVFVKKIRIYGAITTTAQSGLALPEQPCNVRLVIYQDKQTNASNLNVAQLVLLSGNASQATNMFMNPSQFGRFKILKDKKIVLQNPSNAGTTTAANISYPGLVRNFKFTINVNEYVNYNNTNGGTVADVVDNSFHLMVNCTNVEMAPTIEYKARTVFTP